MRFSTFAFVLCIFICSNCFASVAFSPGVYKFQGKIFYDSGKTYLIINYKTNSEVMLLLTGKVPSSLSGQSGSNAQLTVRLKHKLRSSKGSAELVNVDKFLSPFEIPAVSLGQ